MKSHFRMIAVVTAMSFVNAFALISVSRDTTWGPDTVNIGGDVRVESGTTLTIAPASHLVFAAGALQIKGRLLAVGTPSDSISFSGTTAYAAYWDGIRFIKTPLTNDTSKLAYCTIEGVAASMLLPGAVAADSFSKLVIVHSAIRNNGGSGGLRTGGGMYLRNASPLIVNCRFTDNLADGSMSNGGGLYCDNASPVIVNTLFYRNSSSGAAAGGGALYCRASSPLFVNCTFVKNAATGAASFGAGIYCQYGSNPRIINTIFWGNKDDQAPLFDLTCAPFFRNCNIQGGSYVAAGSKAVYEKCMDLDPKFTSDSTGNFSLRSNSPCIDRGTADTIGLGLPPVDLADNPRVAGLRVDIGAYEFSGACACPQVTVTSPDGGEVWTAGTINSITYNATYAGTISGRLVWLSTNNGASFTRIDSGAPGPFAWTIPSNINSKSCLVAVVAFNASGDSGWGVSDSVFSIVSGSGAQKGPGAFPIVGTTGVKSIVRAGQDLVIDFDCRVAGGYSLLILDAAGRLLWRFEQTAAAAGSHSLRWNDRKNWTGRDVLLCILENGGMRVGKKILLTK